MACFFVVYLVNLDQGKLNEVRLNGWQMILFPIDIVKADSIQKERPLSTLIVPINWKLHSNTLSAIVFNWRHGKQEKKCTTQSIVLKVFQLNCLAKLEKKPNCINCYNRRLFKKKFLHFNQKTSFSFFLSWQMSFFFDFENFEWSNHSAKPIVITWISVSEHGQTHWQTDN